MIDLRCVGCKAVVATLAASGFLTSKDEWVPICRKCYEDGQ